MKKLRKVFQFAVPSLPFAITYFAIKEKSVIMGFVAIVCLFAAVHIMPICRKRENLWVFLLAALDLTPVNTVLTFHLIKILSYGEKIRFTDYAWGILFCFVLFCLEEIVLGIAARLIWNRQYVIMTRLNKRRL